MCCRWEIGSQRVGAVLKRESGQRFGSEIIADSVVKYGAHACHCTRPSATSRPLQKLEGWCAREEGKTKMGEVVAVAMVILKEEKEEEEDEEHQQQRRQQT
jgi:hypothetical protein